MNWRKYLLPPVAIYAVIFLFISALIGADVDQTALWVWAITLLITVIGLHVSAKSLKIKNLNEGLVIGLVWFFVFFVLDLVLTIPFTGWGYYNNATAFVPYLLALLFPSLLLKSKPAKKKK